MVRQTFNCSLEDLLRLQLAVDINRASRHILAFDLLNVLSKAIQRDPTGTVVTFDDCVRTLHVCSSLPLSIVN